MPGAGHWPQEEHVYVWSKSGPHLRLVPSPAKPWLDEAISSQPTDM